MVKISPTEGKCILDNSETRLRTDVSHKTNIATYEILLLDITACRWNFLTISETTRIFTHSRSHVRSLSILILDTERQETRTETRHAQKPASYISLHT